MKERCNLFMTFLLDNITIQPKCQEKIERIASRILYKEKLYFPVQQILYNSPHLAPDSKQLERFSDCGKFLVINKNDGKIQKANFCKQRLCPVCNYIKSSVAWHKIKKCVEWIKETNPGVNFIFMTLTVQNCKGEELNVTINNILQGFRRLTNRKTWAKSVLGAIRGLEITYNSKLNSFHPHIHILAVVPADYFSAESGKYITVDMLREWWTESAQLDYFVQVDVRAISQTDDAIAEVAKYAIKMSDLLLNSNEEDKIKATEWIYNCTHGRRLIACLGCFKKAMKQLKLSDLDDFETEQGIRNPEDVSVMWSHKSKSFKEVKYDIQSNN